MSWFKTHYLPTKTPVMPHKRKTRENSVRVAVVYPSGLNGNLERLKGTT